jgi:DNA-binding GntR family transcriptional regulator
MTQSSDAESGGLLGTQQGSRRLVGSDIYESLRQDILANRFEIAAPLVETDLAERYGMSRTPVREALRRLEQDGLVERGRRGLQVRTRSPEEILEIYEVRIDLEAVAAALAAEHRTPFDLARLESALVTMRSISTDDVDLVIDTNQVFQEAIWDASHNATLVDILSRLYLQITRYPSTTLTHPGRWETVLGEYAELIEFIRDRDAARARQLATAHMRAARDLRLQMYASREAGESRA